jgi:hypothetical protein
VIVWNMLSRNISRPKVGTNTMFRAARNVVRDSAPALTELWVL